MYLKISIAVILLSVYGVLGASVSIKVEDQNTDVFSNSTVDSNSTKALNASVENLQKTRALDIEKLSLNVSDTKAALNSTTNSTSSSPQKNNSSMIERAIEDKELSLTQESNSTNASNSSDSTSDFSLKNSSMVERSTEDEKLVVTEEGNTTKASNSSDSKLSEGKVERAAAEVTGNASLLLNATEKVVNNQTTRGVSVNTTSNTNVTTNGTANPWSALPFFRNMTGAKHNSSEVSNSSLATRVVTSANKSNSTEKDGESLDDASTSGTVSDSIDVIALDDINVDGVSTQKPCATVSCLISRGCSDTSCTPDNL